MDLLPSEDDLEIASTVAALVTRELPLSLLHRDPLIDEPAAPEAAWLACAESGVLALALDEDAGGVGLGQIAEVMAFRELGRLLAPGPFLSSVLGAHVAAAAGDLDLATAIASGERRVGLIVQRADAPPDGLLTGDLELLDAVGSDHVLLVAPNAAALFAVADLEGVEAVPAIDPGVRLSVATASGLAPLLLAADPSALHARATLLVSAMLTGIAEATRDASRLHAISREQFGRPIGVNQAIKHRCADMAVSAEAADSQLFYAAAAAELRAADSATHAAIARVIATSAAISNAEANIQVHGGMGYTAEHDAHLFVKRARSLAPLLGGTRAQLSAVLESGALA